MFPGKDVRGPLLATDPAFLPTGTVVPPALPQASSGEYRASSLGLRKRGPVSHPLLNPLTVPKLSPFLAEGRLSLPRPLLQPVLGRRWARGQMWVGEPLSQPQFPRLSKGAQSCSTSQTQLWMKTGFYGKEPHR